MFLALTLIAILFIITLLVLDKISAAVIIKSFNLKTRKIVVRQLMATIQLST
ncbi:hypothetical protein [Jeotgalibacillus terrae]|uniref:Uncharacterized protein n=1 Tax=Jeotgalibacillus terrae TaxID=587735 RepID=A0ABW5ZJT8_9BACL|nr:hypothetical protein [Jeotgalibacillus terrae]MBM7578708.1 hypothetical protein [Jeotgalibacillus terrae]